MMSMKTLPVVVLLILCGGVQCHVNWELASNRSRSFLIENDLFYKDGSQFRILGGSLHYFRVHPQYWEDRLLRAKALGLNVIQTYVPWNVHQPQSDQLNFKANTTADLEGFLKVAQKLDMLVMLRPGPYICGEWDFGGFPAWLLSVEPALSLRTSDASYLKLVDNWWDILLPKVVPFLYREGGPVIMVQIENEYGSFGSDKVYMQHLVAKAKAHLGEDTILYTTDGADEGILENGTLSGDDVYTVVDFPVGWDAAEAFKLQKRFNAPGKSPPLISEFYTGWLTHWGEPLARTDAIFTATALDGILQLNASVVLYMVHGGTNFGFTSGSNTGGTASDYFPDITSYDYDAPIGESGSCDSAKFTALRQVFSNYSTSPLPIPPPLPPRKNYGTVKLFKLSSLFHVLESVSVPPNGIKMKRPRSMEKLGQISGFVLYRSTLPPHTKSGSELFIPEVRDRAQVFVKFPSTRSQRTAETALEYIYVGTLERWSNQSLLLPAAAAVPGLQLNILVENMGRVNYGPFIYDQKGITKSVFLDGIPILGWTAFPIPMKGIQGVTSGFVPHRYPVPNKDPHNMDSGIVLQQSPTPVKSAQDEAFGPVHRKLYVEQTSKWNNLQTIPVIQRSRTSFVTEGPTFYKGKLDIDEPADTFISLRGWSKGVVLINGFNLGRFWPVMGPQCTLYIPAPLFVTGVNELILLELEEPQKGNSVVFTKEPDFNCGLSSESLIDGPVVD